MGFNTELIARLSNSFLAKQVFHDLASGSVVATGCADSFARLVCASAYSHLQRPFLYLTPDEESSFNAASDLGALLERDIPVLPALPPLYQGISPHPDVVAEHALALLAASGAGMLVASVESVIRMLPPHEWFCGMHLDLSLGQEQSPDVLLRKLVAMGYRRGTRVETPGEVAVRGGILDFFPNGAEMPTRMEFDGDMIAAMRLFDPITQLSRKTTEKVELVPTSAFLTPAHASERLAMVVQGRKPPNGEELIARFTTGKRLEGDEAYLPWLHGGLESIISYFQIPPLFVVEEPERCSQAADEQWEQAEKAHGDALARGVHFPSAEELLVDWDDLLEQSQSLSLWRTQAPADVKVNSAFTVSAEDVLHGNFDLLRSNLLHYYEEGYTTILLCDTPGGARRMEEMLSAESQLAGVTHVARGNLRAGFISRDMHLALLTDAAAFGRPYRRSARKRFAHPEFASGRALASINDLLPGDFVVHIQHGIGRYEGTRLIPIDGVLQDFLLITYRDEAKLYVPVSDIGNVQKYLGKDGVAPALEKLGGMDWSRTTASIRKALREMAAELIKLYASRATLPGHAFPSDTVWMEELEDSFPFNETTDQEEAIQAVKSDMESERPMDRLLCGDVGFGKTEVAIRAAFKCALGGKQCAVLVPTTILAAQHHVTFSERMAPFPVRVEMLSRFRNRKEQKEILEKLERGLVDVIIGTHRLLSKDVKFKDLGLLIIDEEHRFGVGHKEKIKQLRETVDVLTMTATPIPRTLNFALAGARDLNLIETAPTGRLPILTAVHVFDEMLIEEAIRKEIERDGQVFFVHNRVENIYNVARWLMDRLPGISVGVGHGQLEEKELERVMDDFMRKVYDVLVTTTIIESGLDMPNANTIIINRADRFGLAQLHQLRGRVGRSDRQAWCYLLTPAPKALTPDARRRLAAIAESTELGSGFRLALRDLEIRGAGNLLGAEQHGHIAAIGYELYVQMLEEEVGKLRDMPTERIPDVRLELTVPAYLPESYVPDEGDRVELYSRLMKAPGRDELEKLRNEILDRFGAPPHEAELLLRAARLRLLAGHAGVSYLKITADLLIVKIAAAAVRGVMGIQAHPAIAGVQLKPQSDGTFMMEIKLEAGQNRTSETVEAANAMDVTESLLVTLGG